MRFQRVVISGRIFRGVIRRAPRLNQRQLADIMPARSPDFSDAANRPLSALSCQCARVRRMAQVAPFATFACVAQMKAGIHSRGFYCCSMTWSTRATID
jgi:hypothetical protein